MCYLIREHRARAAENGGATLPPSLDRLQPRWAGAVAAALIAGVAVAALVAPAPTSPDLTVKDSAPAAPVASSATAVPAAAVLQAAAPTAPTAEKISLDDGVPSPSDVVKAGMDCEHGL